MQYVALTNGGGTYEPDKGQRILEYGSFEKVWTALGEEVKRIMEDYPNTNNEHWTNLVFSHDGEWREMWVIGPDPDRRNDD